MDDASGTDVRQGRAGDCWFLAAVTAISNDKDLIDRICVDRDEAVGVYGFVFHRDGEWFHTIIDDKLYLLTPDWYEATSEERGTFEDTNGPIEGPRKYRDTLQRGSRALYFAQCREENETWLPLLEKAFAKAHGDYASIEGGCTGEGIEDLTGGVTTTLLTSDILDKAQFWRDEVLAVNQKFLFSCATGVYDDWQGGWNFEPRQGIFSLHAYSIMAAVEMKGERLVKVRNPWGSGEWKGPWSDGSEEWTPEWMEALNHRFGDDGVFWISYEDLLEKFNVFERTRLFDTEWTIGQQWTSATVPYSADYNATKFELVVTKSTPAVIVLSQLDDRYFSGLEGEYLFDLRFRLVKEGDDDYVVRSPGNWSKPRSVSIDLPELEAGKYSVLLKITAIRGRKSRVPETVIRESANSRANKVIQIGLSYDLAHAKARVIESAEEKEARLKTKAMKKIKDRAKARKAESKRQKKVWEIGKRQKGRRKRDAARKQAYLEKQAAKKQAEKDAEAANAEEQAEGANDEGDNNGAAEEPSAEPAEETTTGTQDGKRLPTPPAEEEAVVVNGEEEEAQAEGETGEAAEENAEAADGEGEGDQAEDDAEPDPAPGTAEDDYLYDSDASFHSSIDSVLDFPPDEDDDEEEDEDDDDDDQPDEIVGDDDQDLPFAIDPWNAVCVIGLRLYSKDPGSTIKVIRPKSDEEALLEEDDVSKGLSGKEPIHDTQVDNTAEVKTGVIGNANDGHEADDEE